MRYTLVLSIFLLVVGCSRSECCQSGQTELVARAPTPQAGEEVSFEVAGDVVAPVLVTKKDPVLPEHERAQVREQPLMIFQLTIDHVGNVANVRTLKTNNDALLPYVIAAIREWKYQPATLHGRPVRVLYNVTFSYEVR